MSYRSQRVDTDLGLVRVDYDQALLDAVGSALGNLKDQRFKVLKSAVNATAKQATAQLVAKMKEEYTAKKGPIKRAVKVDQKATDSKPEATINVKGTMLELREFRTTAPKSGAKAKILNSSTLKLIQSQTGSRAKAFLATFDSGHTAIVQRQDGKTYKKSEYIQRRIKKYGRHVDMTKIKKLLSLSYPHMGSSVMGDLGVEIYDTLLENVNKEIRRVMRT